MFTCDKCNIERTFDHRDYYDFDHYVCPKCSDVFKFPADSYYIPDDDDLDDDGYEDHDCPYCGGTGTNWDGLGDCEECDGYGYKWWM